MIKVGKKCVYKRLKKKGLVFVYDFDRWVQINVSSFGIFSGIKIFSFWIWGEF